MINTKLTRSKFFSFFISLFLVLNLTSCEGFFTDNNLDQKIRAAIDYANAPSSSFWITADAASGTITPVGKISYKPTDYQNIKFKLKPEYEFIGWNFRYEEIQSGEKYTREITNKNWWKDFIDIINEEISEPSASGEITYTLQIQFKEPEENMLIEPVCALKPVLKSWSGQLGEIQSRNGSLSFVFNTKLDLDASIYFSDTELAECSHDEETDAVVQITPLFNGQNPSRVYGYIKNGETYFKNIEIKYKNRSINSSYCDFRWNNETNTLIMASDPNHNFDIVGDFADIEILFKDGIKSEGQASMKEAKAFVNINKYSDDRSVINTVTNTAKNPETVNLVAQTLYLQEQKTLTFAESENIQFLYWEVTSNSAYPDSIDKVYTEVDEENPRKLNYWGKQKIDSAEEVTISAVYEFRPKILSYTPGANTVAPKDSDIQINFDEEINLASFIAGYKITCGGDPVNDYFDEPVLSADRKSVIIAAKLNNRLLIDSNKQVTVTVPASVYYTKTESDGKTYQITLGQEKQLSYTVKPETRDKAYIQFNIDATQVTIDNFNTANVKTYSIGQTQTIVCNENSGYQFFGWVKNNDANNAIEVIKVDDSTYTFKINQACGLETAPIQINAISKERLSATLTSPLMDSNGVSKDNDIIIDFNHRPTLADCKEYISILYNNINLIDSSFLTDNWDELEETTVSGKTVYRLTIHANPQERLEISNISNIEVRIDEGLSYTDGQYKVYYKPKGDTFKYKINNSTKNKAFVQFEIENGHGTVKSGGSNFIITSTKTYNIGEEVTLTFEEGTNYQFFGWTKTGDENDKIQLVKSDVNNKIYTFRFTDQAGSADSPVRIAAKTIERLRVNKVTPANTDEGVAKDTGINIYFKQKPVLDLCKQKIAITCSGIGNVKSCFPTTDWTLSDTPTSDGYCLSIPADPSNPININALSTITVSFDSNLYYAPGTSTDGQPDQVYYGGEGYSYSYKIKNETNTKANVEFSVPSGQGILTKTVTNPTSGTAQTDNQYSIGKRIKISFEPSTDYEFLYWSVSPTGILKFDDEEDDKFLATTYLTVKAGTSANQTITVTPVCAPKLKVSKIELKNTSSSTYTTDITNANPSSTYPKDSDIVVTFNTSNMVYYTGNVSRFTNISFNDKDVWGIYNFTRPAQNKFSYTASTNPDYRIQLESSPAENKVIFTLAGGYLYYRYQDDVITKLIYMTDDFTKSFIVNSTTRSKTSIKFEAVEGSLSVNGADGSTRPLSSTGTTSYTGNYNLDTVISVNYTPTTGYKFLGWDISNTSYSSYLEIEDVTSPNTTITVKNPVNSSITIKPKSAEYLAIQNPVNINDAEYAASNQYEKDSVIRLKFNKFFAMDDEGIASYISIKHGNEDVTNNFIIEYHTHQYDYPNELWIRQNNSNRLQIDSVEEYLITIDQNLYYKDSNNNQIGLPEDYTLRILLNNKTCQKAKVIVSGYSAYGSINNAEGSTFEPATDNMYNLDETITLNFIPNDDFEFLYWKCETTNTSGATVTLTNLQLPAAWSTVRKNPSISVVVKGASQLEQTTFQPVCRPKLAVNSVVVNSRNLENYPTGYPAGTPYPKDSTITITFNEAPPSTLIWNNYITLKCGEDFVTDKFIPSLSGKILTLTADQTKRLDINTSKNLEITISKDLYYSIFDSVTGTKNISMKEAVTKSIPINYETVNKATVMVDYYYTAADKKGTLSITNAPSTISVGTAADLSKDRSFTLNYTPATGYEFLGWTVTSNYSSLKSNISLVSGTSENPVTVTVTDSKIYSSTSDNTVTIKPYSVEKPKVTTYKVNDSSFNIETSTPAYNTECAKDSSFILGFNTSAIRNYVTEKYLSNYVTVKYGSTDITDYYTLSWNNNQLKITAKEGKRLQNIYSDTNVKITVSSDLYYKNSNSNITMAEDFVLTIKGFNSTTVKKTDVKLNPDTGKGSLSKIDSGVSSNVTESTTFNLSKDITFNLNFTPTADYEFVCWQVEGVTGNVSLSSKTAVSTTVTIIDSQPVSSTNAATTVNITPICVEKLKVTSITVNSSDFDPSKTYPKDSKIKITFNKNLGNVGQYVHLNNAGGDIKDSYFNLTHTNNTSTFTFTPIIEKPLPLSESTTLFVSIDKEIYTTVTSNGVSKKLTLDTNYSQMISIGYWTDYEKLAFQFVPTKKYGYSPDFEYRAAPEAGTVKIEPDSRDEPYYLGQRLKITFTHDDGYSMNEWVFTDSNMFTYIAEDMRGNTITSFANYQKESFYLTILDVDDDYYDDNHEYLDDYDEDVIVLNISPCVAQLTKLKSITPFANNANDSIPLDTTIYLEFSNLTQFPKNSSNSINSEEFISFSVNDTYLSTFELDEYDETSGLTHNQQKKDYISRKLYKAYKYYDTAVQGEEAYKARKIYLSPNPILVDMIKKQSPMKVDVTIDVNKLLKNGLSNIIDGYFTALAEKGLVYNTSTKKMTFSFYVNSSRNVTAPPFQSYAYINKANGNTFQTLNTNSILREKSHVESKKAYVETGGKISFTGQLFLDEYTPWQYGLWGYQSVFITAKITKVYEYANANIFPEVSAETITLSKVGLECDVDGWIDITPQDIGLDEQCVYRFEFECRNPIYPESATFIYYIYNGTPVWMN